MIAAIRCLIRERSKPDEDVFPFAYWQLWIGVLGWFGHEVPKRVAPAERSRGIMVFSKKSTNRGSTGASKAEMVALMTPPATSGASFSGRFVGSRRKPVAARAGLSKKTLLTSRMVSLAAVRCACQSGLTW